MHATRRELLRAGASLASAGAAGLRAVRTFQPLDAPQMAALRARTATAAAAAGEYERFKTSAQYDATAQNPEWLG